MLENYEMEKKIVRSGQSPKGVDVKKVQDVPQPKLCTKIAKKRESSGESRKTNNVSKAKWHDKRPAPRKAGNSGTAIAQLEEQLEELGVGSSKTKKRNVAHLLNFRCKPRNDLSFHGEPRTSFLNAAVYNVISTQKHKYNKEQFLQASCQFVVRAKEDYSPHLVDPDILVDWDLIEQVRVLSPEGINCPICLYPPVAAKITRCGHIYCWSCVLHYLSLTDNDWQKCPICFESIYQKDLKSVHIIERKPIFVGDVLTFQLMKREKGSTIVMPVSEVNSRSANNFLVASESEHTTVYSKILLADYENVLNIIEEEEFQVRAQLSEYEHCPEYCFVEKAISILKERKDHILKELSNKSSESGILSSLNGVDLITGEDAKDYSGMFQSVPISKKLTYVSAFDDARISDEDYAEENEENVCDDTKCGNKSYTEMKGERRRFESVSSNGEETFNLPINPDDLELPACTCTATSAPKAFFFYQSEDGQQIFMHSLNARMLAMSYGGLDRAPLKIQGTVLEKESGSMTEDLRKRLRYLEHLPITSVFEVVEIDMQPPLITDETEAFFIAQVEKRYRRRYKRAKEENKIDKKVKEMEQIRYGKHRPPPRLHLDSLQDFPECGSDTPPNMSPKNCSPQSSRSSSPHTVINDVGNVMPMQMNNTFAQKLKSSISGAGNSGVWAKRTIFTNSAEEDGRHQPSSGCNLSEAVEAALKKANLEKSSDQSKNGKKKKKPKPIPLYAVGMAYSQR